MWDMRRGLNVDPMPSRRIVIQFIFGDLPKSNRDWWILVDPESGIDVCQVDPGFDVDLFVNTDLRTMTAIWMGLDTVAGALDYERMFLTGERDLATSMQRWLGLSPFAVHEKQVA